jgi:hypothetical protein
VPERKFVVYRGVWMVAGWPDRIQAAQGSRDLLIEGVRFSRIPYGSESESRGADTHPCRDCRVIKGEFHVSGCDVEECPCCHGQLITCDCEAKNRP